MEQGPGVRAEGREGDAGFAVRATSRAWLPVLESAPVPAQARMYTIATDRLENRVRAVTKGAAKEQGTVADRLEQQLASSCEKYA